MRFNTMFLKAGKWASLVVLAGLCSACAQTSDQSAQWDKGYEGVVSASRVPTMGPSAGI